jgi:hypothetical protein
MYTSRSPVPGRNPEDIKVGPLQVPVPWLIPLCIFSPFAVTFIIFLLHRYTIKRYSNKRAALEEQEGEQEVSEDVELQVRRFMRKA